MPLLLDVQTGRRGGICRSDAGLKRLDDSWAAEHVPAGLDVMVDDGCHLPFCQVRTLELYWPRIKIGGLYVIEDLFISPRRGSTRTDWAESHPLLNHSLIEESNEEAKGILANFPSAWFVTGLDTNPKSLRAELSPGVKLTREHVAKDASLAGWEALVAIQKV